MKKFLVTLNSGISYSFADGQKLMAGKAKVVSEDDIQKFRDAGVFNIGEMNAVKESKAKAKDAKSLKAKPRSSARAEKNLEDQGEVVEETTEGLAEKEDKAKNTKVDEAPASKPKGKPKGVITKSSLKK